MLENGPEVNFDKLPLRSMTEMTKYSAQTSEKNKVKNISYVGQIQEKKKRDCCMKTFTLGNFNALTLIHVPLWVEKLLHILGLWNPFKTTLNKLKNIYVHF